MVLDGGAGDDRWGIWRKKFRIASRKGAGKKIRLIMAACFIRRGKWAEVRAEPPAKATFYN